MKNLYALFLLLALCCLSCGSEPTTTANDESAANTEETSSETSEQEVPYLVMVMEESDEGPDEYGYVSPDGKSVVQMGKYSMIFTDTLRNFGIVMTFDGELMAIDKKGKELYEVYMYDNGPDYISDGLFRMIKDGKIGYADETGKIVIEPQFTCTNPFENGKAKVAVECELVKDGEYTRMESDSWFYINTKGEKVEG